MVEESPWETFEPLETLDLSCVPTRRVLNPNPSPWNQSHWSHPFPLNPSHLLSQLVFLTTCQGFLSIQEKRPLQN